MHIISLSKLYTALLVFGAVALIVEAGPTPKKVATPAPAVNAKDGKTLNQTTKLSHRVCTPRPKGSPPSQRKKVPSSNSKKPAPAPVVKASKIKRSRLDARAYTPAKATGKIKLYHGTEFDFTNPDWSKVSPWGGEFGKAFYLTDRKKAALQFACVHDSVFFGEPDEIAAAEMWVNEYEWDGTGAVVHAFTGTSDPDLAGYKAWVGTCTPEEKYQKIFDSNMIAGPMDIMGRGFTNNMWQYAIMDKETAAARLKFIDKKKIKCDPEGRPGNFD